MFSETPLWEMDGVFVVMNADFALAKHNTTKDAYRNMYMALIPDMFIARTDSDYCNACGQLQTTQKCEYSIAFVRQSATQHGFLSNNDVESGIKAE